MRQAKTLIVDDDKKNIKLLEHFIETYCPNIKIVGKASTRKDAIKLINEKEPELIFMDIILDAGTGFDVLESIKHSKYKVIFVSSYSEYAIKAFKFNAIDYILKPIAIEELILAVNKAYEDIENELFTMPDQVHNLSGAFIQNIPLDFIAISSINKIEFVKLKDIIYLNSEGRYTVFNLVNNQKIVASRNIGEFENIINENDFFRIHNSYIINLKHVEKITKVDGNYCKMSNKESLPIARRRQEQLNRFLRIK